VLPVLIGIAMFPGLLDCYIFSFNGKLCLPSTDCSRICSWFVSGFVGMVMLPAAILSCCLYAVLYCKAFKIRRSLYSDGTVSDLNRFNQEWKAVVTFSLLFLTVFMIIVPTTLVSIVIHALSFGAVSHVVVSLNTAVTFLMVVVDPIVIMRNKDVKEVLSNIKNRILQRPPTGLNP
jgi:hypothetical protein